MAVGHIVSSTSTILDASSKRNTKDFIEKFSSIKQVAHAWKIGGVSYVDNQRIDLEGARFVDFRKTFQKSLQDFYATNKGMISPKEMELLSSLLEEREVELFKQDASVLFEDFQKGKSVSISSGFIGHRVIIAFDKDYLLIANKGMATRRPIEIYKINPEKITKNSFQEIVNLSDGSELEYNKWLGNISSNFNATKDPLSLYIEQAYPLSSYQEVGNCVWESLQTCVYGILMLNRLRVGFDSSSSKTKILINTSNKVFLTWQEFLKIQSLERFFRAHHTSSNPLPCLTERSTEEISDGLITFEGIDRDILRNIFRQFWGNKPISIEFGNKMEKLEMQYLNNLNGVSLTCAKIEKLYYNQMSQFSYIVRDLTTVWIPSVLNTAIAATSYVLPPSVKPDPIKLWIYLLLPSYSYSVLETIKLTRRYFAV